MCGVFALAWPLALLTLSGRTCAANTIYVPLNQPSIQAAIDAAAHGDTVVVAPGTYLEKIDFHGKAIVVKSQSGPRSTTIDGQRGGSVITMHSSEGMGTVVEGFTITGGSASFGAGVYLLNSAPTFRNNIFRNNQQAVGGFGAAIGGFSGSPYIVSNEFVGNSCDNQFLSGVLSFVNSSSPKIVNNVIHDNDCRAINMTLPDTAAPSVSNNTIVRNRTGIYVDHRVSNAAHTYQNNLIISNGIGLEVTFPSSAFDGVWKYNLMFGNVQDVAGTADMTGTYGNLKADPQFIGSAVNDFRLAIASPAVDTGSDLNLVLPPTDFLGSARIQDGNGDGISQIDIGAIEKTFATAAPVDVPVGRIWLVPLILSICLLAREARGGDA
jgi:serine protease